jgi:hypothetical protein
MRYRKNKMPRKTFTKEILDQSLKRDSAILIGEYDGGGRRTLIKYRCSCGNEREKSFCLVVSSGAICKDCVYKKQKEILAKGRNQENIQKGLQTKGNPDGEDKVFSLKALDESIKKDNAELIGSYPILFGKTLIKFKCCCGCETEQEFQHILGATHEKREKGYCGALCDDCNKKRWIQARQETNIERYGKKGGINITEESTQRRIETCMKKYNVPSPNQAESVKQKKIDTSLKNWGTENPAQNQEVMERTQKNAKRFKEFVMPSGDIRKVQGYEPFALKKLLEVYTEDQLKTSTKNVPRIQYEVNGKKRYHFPDIFIPHENKLVEVKSTWTFKNKADNVLLKKKFAEEQGFLYEIWCFDGKGKRVEV